MKETGRLDKQIEQLRLTGRQTQAQLNGVLIAALDDQRAIQQAPELREAIAAIPVQIGELTRRRVLAHIQELADEAAALGAEFERQDAVHTEYREAIAAWRKRERAITPAQLSDYAVEGRLIDEKYRPGVKGYELLRTKLASCYAIAANTYGVGLDGSDFEAWATGRRNNYPLPHDRAAWEAVAVKRGQEAERKAAANVWNGKP